MVPGDVVGDSNEVPVPEPDSALEVGGLRFVEELLVVVVDVGVVPPAGRTGYVEDAAMNDDNPGN